MFEHVTVPAWSKINNPAHYLNRSSDTVLVTAGDSWTYGDSLGATKVRNGIDDTEYRLANVYGATMSARLDCDWINLALPGGSNALILDWLESLLPKLKYKHIICALTLTESGRHEELNYIKSRHVTQKQCLEEILSSTYSRADDLNSYCKLIVAHNFTDSIKSTVPLPRSWLEVMLNKQVQNGTHIVISDHIQQMNYTRTFPDVVDIIDCANARINLLDSCEHCHKEDSRHPTEAGHRLWAEYLLGNL